MMNSGNSNLKNNVDTDSTFGDVASHHEMYLFCRSGPPPVPGPMYDHPHAPPPSMGRGYTRPPRPAPGPGGGRVSGSDTDGGGVGSATEYESDSSRPADGKCTNDCEIVVLSRAHQ